MSDHIVVRACAGDEAFVFASCKLLFEQHMKIHERTANVTDQADSNNGTKNSSCATLFTSIIPSVLCKFVRDP